MAVQPAAKLTAIPEFPSLARRATGEYNGMAYNFGTHMGGDGPFVSEINALAGNVQHNAQEAVDAAGGSSDAQEAAEAARDAAADSAGAADGFPATLRPLRPLQRIQRRPLRTAISQRPRRPA